MRQLVVFSWNRTMVPRGAISVLLQLNMPWRAVYADNFGSKQKLRKRCKLNVACSRNWFHSLGG